MKETTDKAGQRAEGTVHSWAYICPTMGHFPLLTLSDSGITPSIPFNKASA